MRAYPNLTGPSATAPDLSQVLFLPMQIEGPDGTELSFFSTIATFGTALDVTLAELSIEAFFPADDVTREALAGSARA